MDKYFPQIGDKLYLTQNTGNEWVDMVHRPYTVIGVTNNTVTVQACRLIFNGPRYYDTLPDGIEEDPYGETKVLHWAPTKGLWQDSSVVKEYPYIAIFGEWDYQPYLN